MSARQTILNQVMRFADPADMDVGNWDICTDNILSALDAAGYAVVPKEPTERMAMAFHEAQWRAAQDRTYLRRLEDFADRYKAMLAAAKETP